MSPAQQEPEQTRSGVRSTTTGVVTRAQRTSARAAGKAAGRAAGMAAGMVTGRGDDAKAAATSKRAGAAGRTARGSSGKTASGASHSHRPSAGPRVRSSSRMTRTRTMRNAATVGDVALGAGVLVGVPAAKASTRLALRAEDVGYEVGTSLFEALPTPARSIITDAVRSLASTGRQARADAVENLVAMVVAEVLASDVVRSAMTSAVEGAMEEVVAASMPAVVDKLRDEIGLLKLDEMVRASVERVLPQVVEQDIASAVVRAATMPARTARGLVRMPGSGGSRPPAED